MVCLSQLNEDRARSKAGMDKNNVIVNPKVLRKELLKIYYAKDVNAIMNIVYSLDMVEPKPKMKYLGNGISVTEDFDLSKINNKERPMGKSL